MRPPIRTIAATLALGAVLNVAVAWSCAIATDLGRGTISELYGELPDGYHWEVYRWDNMAGTRIFSKCWNGASIGPYNHGEPETLLAGWGRIARPDTTLLDTGAAAVEEAWGLPLRTLRSHTAARRDDAGAMVTTATGSITLRQPQGFVKRGIYLPLLPVWWAVVVNTVVYALVVRVIYAVIRDLRAAAEKRKTAAGAQPVAGETGAESP